MTLERAKLNQESQVLADLLIERFPEWIFHAGISEFEESGSLYVDVPSPVHAGHFLQIEHRGSSFEVAASDGTPKGRAEAIFVFAPGKEEEIAMKAVQFLHEFVSERIWLQVKPRAQFLDPGDHQRKLDSGALVYSWLGTYDTGWIP